MGGEFGGEWVHEYVWLSPFAVYLKLSQSCLLVGCTPIQNKMLKTTNRKRKTKYLWEMLVEVSLLLLLLLSRFSRVRLCVTLEMAAHQAPPSLGFSRQEHWSGFPFPSSMRESEK